MRFGQRLLTLFLFVISGIALIAHAQDTNELWESLQVISAENASNLRRLATFTLTQGSVLDISFGTNGSSLLIANSNGTIQAWDYVAEASDDFLNYEPAVYATFSSDATKLACQCGSDSPMDDVHVFDLQTGENQLLIEDRGSVSDLTFNQSGQQLIVAGGWTYNDAVVQVWDVELNRIVTTLPDRGWTSKVDFAPTTDIIAAGYANSIELWNLDTATQLSTLEQYYALSDEGGLLLKVGDVAFNSTGARIASMSPEGLVWLWNAETGAELEFLIDESIVRDTTETLYSQAESRIRFNPSDDLLAAVNRGAVRLWRVDDGVLLKTLTQEASKVLFNSDGTILATANEEGMIVLWGVPATSTP